VPSSPQKSSDITVVIHYFTDTERSIRPMEHEVDRYFASIKDAARWLLTPAAEATFAAVEGLTRIEIAILTDDVYPGR